MDQAKCGARAFDIRPYLRANGKLVFHHGDAVVNYSLTKALEELVEWNMEHPEELIILSYSHYAAESGNNQDAATALGDVFAHLGIKLGHMGNLVHVDATAGTSESVTVAEAQEISGPGIPLAVATTEITNTYYDLGGDVMGQCYRFMSIDEVGPRAAANCGPNITPHPSSPPHSSSTSTSCCWTRSPAGSRPTTR